MKKKFLYRLNLVLGAASLALAGCHTSKPAVQPSDQPEQGGNGQAVQAEPRPMLKYGVPTQLIIAMYGVPVNIEEPKDTIQ